MPRHRRDIASDAGQAQPRSQGRVPQKGGASARGLEAPGVGACVEISLHAIEPTRSRRQRRVDGVGRPKFDFHAGRRPRPRRPSASARRRSLMKPQRRPRARKLSMLGRRRRRFARRRPSVDAFVTVPFAGPNREEEAQRRGRQRRAQEGRRRAQGGRAQAGRAAPPLDLAPGVAAPATRRLPKSFVWRRFFRCRCVDGVCFWPSVAVLGLVGVYHNSILPSKQFCRQPWPGTAATRSAPNTPTQPAGTRSGP